MIRKSDRVRSLVSARRYKEALRIAKDFRLGITHEQSRSMTKAYECMVHERFYLSMGEDTKARISEGIQVLVGIYGKEQIRNAETVHKPI